jgi:hypothetical protein
MGGQERTWRAFHVFYFDEQHVDALILEAARLISSLTPLRHAWFFIRYNVSGMHLRFRLRGELQCFDELLLGLREKAWALAQSPPARTGIPAGAVPDDRGHFYYPGSVAEIPYRPETDRYGGPHALPGNEALFELSTSIAVKIIGATPDDRPKRARLAIDLMLAAATVAVEDDGKLGAFLDSYSQFWALQYFQAGEIPEECQAPGGPAVLERLGQLRDYAASDAAPRTPSQYWLRGLAEARRRFEDLFLSGKLVSPKERGIVADREAFGAAVSDMLMSQMHMMNNRLGFWPYVEMMWAGALARSLGR